MCTRRSIALIILLALPGCALFNHGHDGMSVSGYLPEESIRHYVATGCACTGLQEPDYSRLTISVERRAPECRGNGADGIRMADGRCVQGWCEAVSRTRYNIVHVADSPDWEYKYLLHELGWHVPHIYWMGDYSEPFHPFDWCRPVQGLLSTSTPYRELVILRSAP